MSLNQQEHLSSNKDENVWNRAWLRLNAIAERGFSWTTQYPLTFAFMVFALMVLALALAARFDGTLNKDATSYLSVAVRIVNGDWSPSAVSSQGWPIVQAAFLRIFGVETACGGIILAKGLSIVLLGLCIFPLSRIARRILDVRAATLVIVAFATFPALYYGAGRGLTEPLFILLLLWTADVLTGAGANSGKILLAAVLAGLAYYVRPNGVFILAMILLYALPIVVRKEMKWRTLFYIVAVFFAVSALHLYLRYDTYGSPFYFGANSKYFVDSYSQVWDDSVPVPTLWTYLSTHGVVDYIDKFVIHGVLGVAAELIDGVLNPLWSILFIFGIVKYSLVSYEKRLLVPLLFLVVMYVSLIPVWQVFGHYRHLLQMVPFVLLISAQCLTDLLKSERAGGILAGTFALLLIAHPVGYIVTKGYYKSYVPLSQRECNAIGLEDGKQPGSGNQIKRDE